MRMQDIAEGAEYAVGENYQWDRRFKEEKHYTARARVIEKNVLRTSWRGVPKRDGVKVHFLDPITGEPRPEPTDPKYASPVKVLASRDIRQDWQEFSDEHAAEWSARMRQNAARKAYSEDQLAQLSALVGDLDDENLPSSFRRDIDHERRSPGSHRNQFDALINLLERAYDRGSAGGAF